MEQVRMDTGATAQRNFLHELTDFVARGPTRVFLRAPGSAAGLTRQAYVDDASRLAGALLERGMTRGAVVGLLLGNSPEYYIADTAVLAAGGTPVSLYPTSSSEQLAYMARDAGMTVLITEAQYVARLTSGEASFDMFSLVILTDAVPLEAVDAPWPVLDLRSLLDGPGLSVDLAQAAEAISPDDLLTLVYTSGTTGAPKGVRLSHANLLSAARSMGALMQLSEGGRILAWLPHAHVAGRNGQYYCAVMFGLEVTLCEDPKQLPALLPTVRPTWFFAVPRLWEKLKAGIEAEFARLPESAQTEVRNAIDARLQRLRDPGGGAREQALRLEEADARYFAPLRTKLGLDQARVLNTGTAPTPVHVLEFFAALGLPIGDIFGATETCACGSMGQAANFRLGSAGQAVPGMEISIADDGEVLLRGQPVMQGYHNQPSKTAEALSKDGWYRTGDVGRLDADGFLWITDRKKELIISSSGKNMSPANIEAMIKSGDPLIGQVCVIGDARPYNTALIVIDPDYAQAWATARQIKGTIGELARHPELLSAITAGVERGNQRLSRVEQVKRFTVLEREWPPGGDELTTTMKLRRKAVEHKYASDIEQLYTA
ncbi:long-chain fatty acid--CoA ligase [Halopseudomonas nanhaiensis]|uniref:AMP-dependent synthetase/ligase n=1 Tax=Halopseudomonas nanhaiensis TaxID=2830842 RepID=UPI001CBCC417|nr:long-chain fatty acid--CoA ligase [Halopseudomonas nanhaiensis]UAW97585.1 long-chain fatty acid--CoA ligase [Halopseudomonas nanhaiensis]